NGDGSYTLMDPTDENTRQLLPAYLCDKSYLVAHPEGESLRRSPIEPAARNMMHIRTIGRVDETGVLEAVSHLSFGGINDNAYREYFSRVKPAERRRLFEGRLKDIVPGAKLIEFDIQPADVQDVSKPLEVKLKFRARDFPISSAEGTIIPPLWLGSVIGYANWVLGQTGLEKRKYPLYTDVACGIEETLELDLRDAVGEAISLPGMWHIATNKLTFLQSFQIQTNTLQAKAVFVLNDVEFSPPEYLILKQQLKDVEYARKMRPVFKRGRTGEPDVEVLIDETEISLDDAQSWVESRRVDMKVLTYAGKKRFSELKFSFNPLWSRVTLEEATVTGPNGRAYKVAPEEINIMDAPWVGAAPRYPAERTMVVSLPGVEIGSRVNYRITRNFYGVPFFSAFKTFADFEPVCSNIFRVVVPSEVNLHILERTQGMVEVRTRREMARRVYEWCSTRQPVLQREDSLPPLWSFCPSVFLSTGDWGEYVRHVSAVLRNAARETDETRTTVRRIIAGKNTDSDRAVT
ncbi:MAG: DUF3857 domain-containing protein, partial [Kiritimatiellae bacterium]|nr:DUF3857 domain-containing protein [Kiritimatiellia bacterium]